jgi:hypothetical protein
MVREARGAKSRGRRRNVVSSLAPTATTTQRQRLNDKDIDGKDIDGKDLDDKDLDEVFVKLVEKLEITTR